MCYYITLTLPKETKLGDLKQLIDHYDMAFHLIQNSSVSSQLHDKDLYLRATKKYCDCDTSLGSLNRDSEINTLLNSKKVKNLRKKNWTDEQIDEWIQKKLESKEIKTNKTLTPMERDLEIQSWIDLIKNIVISKNVEYIGVLKHWYSRDLESEVIKIKDVKPIQVNLLESKTLLELAEDVLYKFVS